MRAKLGHLGTGIRCTANKRTQETRALFGPLDNWWDFYQRWYTERKRRSQPVAAEALTMAVQRASGAEATLQGYRAIAVATLGLVARGESQHAALPV